MLLLIGRVEASREAQKSAGKAPGYDGKCRDLTAEQVTQFKSAGREPVLRMRMPDGSTTFTDVIRGELTFEHEFVPDFVLVRADGSPLYTLAVAVDDVLMKVTHVLRGEDLLSSTPRQIRVYQAMGVPESEYPFLLTFHLLWDKTTRSFLNAMVKHQLLGIAKWDSCLKQFAII